MGNCCAGSNTFIPVPAPGMNGDGTFVSVANLAAKKTIFLAGTFNGRYVILGSHDDVNFVPLEGATFTGGGQPQSLRKDVDATLKSVRVRRQADALVTVVIGGQATCDCAETPPGPT